MIVTSYRKLLLVILFALLTYTLTIIYRIIQIELTISERSDFQCSLYLYDSNIEGTGTGVFAGRDFAQNEIISRSAVVRFRLESLRCDQKLSA